MCRLCNWSSNASLSERQSLRPPCGLLCWLLFSPEDTGLVAAVEPISNAANSRCRSSVFCSPSAMICSSWSDWFGWTILTFAWLRGSIEASQVRGIRLLFWSVGSGLRKLIVLFENQSTVTNYRHSTAFTAAAIMISIYRSFVIKFDLRFGRMDVDADNGKKLCQWK